MIPIQFQTRMPIQGRARMSGTAPKMIRETTMSRTGSEESQERSEARLLERQTLDTAIVRHKDARMLPPTREQNTLSHKCADARMKY